MFDQRVAFTMAKRVMIGHQGLRAISQGTKELAHLVGTTYGPQGGKVAVSKLGRIVITTDGQALGKEAQFRDYRRLGVGLLQSTSSSSFRDGTSTAILITDALISTAMGLYTQRWDPVSIVNGIQKSWDVIKRKIIATSQKADEKSLAKVGMMASHGDELVSSKVLEAVLQAGSNGTVVLTSSDGVGIELVSSEGLTLAEGWCNQKFSEGVAERTIEGPLVATVANPLLTMEDVQSMMESATQWPGRALVVFCPRAQGEALTTLIVNHDKGILKSMGVVHSGPPHHFRDWLENIAAVTNSTIVDKNAGMRISDFDPTWFGYARKILVKTNSTVLTSYMDDEISKRIDERTVGLFSRADSSTFDHEKDRLRQMASSLDGGLVTVKIGGYTEHEAQDRRSRAEDVLGSLQSCLNSGVVPGAGSALVAATNTDPEDIGEWVLARALEEPLRVLAYRSGSEPEVVLEKVRETLLEDPSGWTGWDPVTKTIREFSDDPMIVDPLDTILESVDRAVSIGCQILLTGVVITRP